MEGVGGVEHDLAVGPHHLGSPEVDVGRGVQADARVAVLVVVWSKNMSENALAASRLAKRLGKLGTYL